MLKRYLPILSWLPGYSRHIFTSDLVAALIVTIMLIPQSLAYALLAGLPAEVGLYASILPLLAYTVFGTSRTLSVGPVAVISLMTAAAAGAVTSQGSPEYTTTVIILAFLSGLILTLMGLFRLGFLANFLSHPVIAGFITASALIIAGSQLGLILGLNISGHNLLDLGAGFYLRIGDINWVTFIVGASTLAFLYGCRRYLKPLLIRMGLNNRVADLTAKAGPVLGVILTTLTAWALDLQQYGVALVGEIPAGLPSLVMPSLDLGMWQQLLIPALLISMVGFVESVSVAQTLAAKKRQRIEPDQELIGLGAANLSSAFSGGLPVTGGFSRSVVNFDAGAETPAAGAFAAIGIALATLFLTPLIMYLPKATLAATIIIAVMTLVDFSVLRRYWSYSKSDFAAALTTILTTLVAGVELGILTGVGLSLALYLYQASRPHSAVVGQVPGTEHFRNINRHQVETDPQILLYRMDESLFFANTRFLEDRIYTLVSQHQQLTDVLLMCSAVNHIDGSALDSLEAINTRLLESGVRLHLSEVKGPVMDRLQHTQFLRELSGEVFLTTYEGWCRLRQAVKTGTVGQPVQEGHSASREDGLE